MMTNCDPKGLIIVKVYRYKCNSCKFDRQEIYYCHDFLTTPCLRGIGLFFILRRINTTIESFKANLYLPLSSLVFTWDEVSCSAELRVKKVL